MEQIFLRVGKLVLPALACSVNLSLCMNPEVVFNTNLLVVPLAPFTVFIRYSLERNGEVSQKSA